MPPMKRLPTVMRSGHKFSMVPSVQIERSVFDRSHGHKLTFESGFLIPVLVDEVLPGDTVTCRMHGFCRLATPIKPFMDNMYLDSFFFFIPYRLVWANWVKFMGEQNNPGDSIAFTIPSVTVPFTPAIHSVHDYFGVMTQATNTAIQTPNAISALPYRAYYRVYNEWFRDENLVNANAVGLSTTDGPEPVGGGSVLKRGKRHDYFTSCLPFLQKGTASTFVGTVKTSATALFTGAQQAMQVLNTSGAAATGGLAWAATGGVAMISTQAAAGNTHNLYPSNLYADIDVNNLRQAVQIQRLLERDARGGTRYTEIIWSHFRVKSPDARLQRTEYLGGGSSTIVTAPVAQTTQASTPLTPTFKDALGNLGAVTASSIDGHGFTKSFTEHGILLGIISVRADLTYQQGVERMWFRSTRYDFYWPALAHLGEQAVLSREIWFDGTTAQNAADVGVFGYQERYAEYRYKPSRISGLFRSNAAGTLEVWHLSEKFGARPTLGQTFIEDQTETVLDTRVWVNTEPDWYADLWFDFKWARPMPVFGVPGMMDHF